MPEKDLEAMHTTLLTIQTTVGSMLGQVQKLRCEMQEQREDIEDKSLQLEQ